MKKSIVLLTLVVFMASGFAFAAGKQINANIPFAFYVEDRLLPAGEYNFEIKDRLLTIRTKDGAGIGLFVMTGSAIQNGMEDSLQFKKYGNQFFLSSLATGSYRSVAKMAKTERGIKTAYENAILISLPARKQAKA
jgi:hypothetical protein